MMRIPTRLSPVTGACLAAAIPVFVAVGCAGAPRGKPIETSPIESGAGTVTTARLALKGRWDLVSFDVFPPGRPAINVPAQGTLLYDDFGNLDMQLKVPDPSVAERLQLAGVPLKDGVIATSGRTAIDMQNHTLTYIMEGSKGLVASADSAAPLAAARPRHWEYANGILTLTTKGNDGQPLSVGRWKKAQ
jgi:hypothetical protein